MSFDLIEDVPEEYAFLGSRGERCVRLALYWETLFDCLNRSGTAMMGIRSGALTLLSHHDALDLHPVPGTSEWTDLLSEWSLETSCIHSAIAVEEGCGRRLPSLQFFNEAGTGLFKV